MKQGRFACSNIHRGPKLYTTNSRNFVDAIPNRMQAAIKARSAVKGFSQGVTTFFSYLAYVLN